MSEDGQAKDADTLILAALNGFLQATAIQRWRDIFIEEHWQRKQRASKNPLLRKGEKFYSQSDEDGITLEICRRLGLKHGFFAEIGVGNGLENNSLVLLMQGWRGVWLGGEPLAFEVPDSGPLFFQQCWITRENCAELLSHALEVAGVKEIDFLSVDVDGNDLYVLEALLAAGLRPKAIVCEYNGKFPPPVRWSIAYDAGHTWDGTDYQGASLQSFVDVASKSDYRLVACNVTGQNAFFVRNADASAFSDVPTAIEQLFVSPDYNWFMSKGLPASPRTIARFLER